MSAWKPSVFGRFTIFQQLDLALHAVHAAPADLAFGREPLAELLRDIARLPERLGNLLRVARRILRPVRRARRRVDADDAVLADAECRAASSRSRRPCAPASESSCDPLRSPIAEPPPVGGHTGATTDPTTSPLPRILSASRFRSSSVESMLTCGSNRNRSTPSNFAPFDVGLRRQVEHRVEIDRRFGARTALADQAGPHGVVKRWDMCGHSIGAACQAPRC